ncbi:iron-sulfur cluster assembly protein [Thermomicrobiaceae bacterium CFH 74404]|uniref:Iron-sulfur cluster assembly protein n=1 Tax=Thermalbibacter longus TaxID=2951981 RepID=A0AA42BA94_9BACT|nr:iron-sulfur cluster assembly protein [Thermalbibacter longus]MCM8748274.1 iron-sulfur cluster assembly protein [Thermalbibacter longus]
MAAEHVTAIWREIAETVRDPAVNRTIGELGIIRTVELNDRQLRVRLRPCTPECWPLAMAGIVRSIRRYAEARGWGAEVQVEPAMLISPESMDAVIQEVEQHPERLREFWERSYTVSLVHLIAALQLAGVDESRLVSLTVAEVEQLISEPGRGALEAWRTWRRHLGLPDDGLFLLTADGRPITDLAAWARRARLAQVTQRTYAAICRDTSDAFHGSERDRPSGTERATET